MVLLKISTDRVRRLRQSGVLGGGGGVAYLAGAASALTCRLRSAYTPPNDTCYAGQGNRRRLCENGSRVIVHPSRVL